MYGEDSLRVTPEGMMEVVYPASEIIHFTSRDIKEIRVREERYWDESKQKFGFRSTGFSILAGYSNYEKFWVDLKDLDKFKNVLSGTSWFDVLIHMKYKGFQYMQVACNEDFIRN